MQMTDNTDVLSRCYVLDIIGRCYSQMILIVSANCNCVAQDMAGLQWVVLYLQNDTDILHHIIPVC